MALPHYRERACPVILLLNEATKNLIANSGIEGSEDIMFADRWNMTKDSNSDDGLHSLMDVNQSKASQVCRYAGR